MMTWFDRARNSGFAVAVVLALALSPLAAFAKPIVQDDAVTAVHGWLHQPGRGLKTPLGDEVRNTEVYADAAGDPLYFVVNLKPSGFVIVPADDLVEPILFFCPAGQYVASEKNPLGALVMRDVPGRLALARAKAAAVNPQPHQKNAQRKWEQFRAAATAGAALPGLSSVSDLRVAAIIQSSWDQSNTAGGLCCNYYTPGNVYDGCAATAMAQLMRFYQYPTAGVGTASFEIEASGTWESASLRGGNGSGGPYDWADMPLVPANGLTTTQRQAIGALCYDAGVSVNMEYSGSGSGADPTEIAPALKSVFFYSNAICGGNGSNIGSGLIGMLNPNLDAGFPCLLSIYTSGYGAGHEIVADGYGYESSTLYHHLNLGWSGYDNGWYNLPDFDAGGYDWVTVAFCIYNIYPAGSGEIISGRVTDSTGAAIGGVTVTGTRAGGGVYTATTNANGIYALAQVPSASSYTLTAVLTGYAFSPQNVSTGTSSNYNSTSADVWGANFTPTSVASTWTLAVNSSPVQGAAVTGTNPGATNYSIAGIASGTAAGLTAPATFVSGGTTYNFTQWEAPAGWTVSGATVSGSINSDTTLQADYAAQTWTLTVNSAPVQGIAIAGTYPGTTNYSAAGVTDGTTVSLTAPAGDPAGYTFSQWTVNGAAQTSGQKAITFTVSAATTAVAQYTLNSYVLNVQSTPPAGIAIASSTGNGGTTSYSIPAVPYGASVNLQAPATDPAGYTFSQWTLNGAAQTSGQRAITFTVSAATTAVAQYTVNTAALSVQSTPPAGIVIASTTGDGGTTSYSIAGVAYGASVNLQAPATDPAGYTFSQWTLNGAAQTSDQKAITFAMNAATTAVAQYTVNNCLLSVQSTPPTGIVIASSTGNSGTTGYTNTLAYGTSVSLQAPATDPAGYTFSQWTLNGAAQTLGQKAITFTMTAATTAVAQYAVNSCLLNVQSTPPTGIVVASSTGNSGTTSYTDTAAYGTSVNLQAPATDPAGYTFSQWTLNGAAQPSGQKAITFTLNAAATAVAQYAVNDYALTVQSTPPAGIAIASSTGYGGTTNYTIPTAAYGTSVNLQAPAADPAGYTFAQWTVNGTAQAAGQKAITFTMTAATTAVAQYTANSFALTVQSTPPTGIVIASSTGNNGTTSYTNTVAYGASVNLQAPAADPSGYTFTQWTLNGAAQTSGQKAITFTMAAATTAVAQYTVNTCALSVQSTPPTGIAIASSKGNNGTTNYTNTVPYGATVNLQAPATDPAGYAFSYWSLNGVPQASGQKAITFTITAGTTALAAYTQVYTLSVQSTPPNGIVIASSTGNNGTTSYTGAVAYDATVNLQAPATDPAGYTFSRWTLNGAAQVAGQKSLTFTMIAAKTAVAQYTLNTFTLNVQSTPPTGLSIGSISGYGGTTNYTKTGIAYGASVNLQAPATNPSGYAFSAWTLNGVPQASGQKAITFTMGAATTALAQYTRSTYTLTVQSTPPTGIAIASSTADGGTTSYTLPGIAYGASINLQAPATDPAGYTFSYWTLGGVTQPAGRKAVTFTMTASMTAAAQYTANTYTLTVQSSPLTGLSIGSSTGDGWTTNYALSMVKYGASVNLQAPAADPTGYTFSHWSLNGAAQTAGQKAITFTMAAATTAVAQYTVNTCTLTVQSSPPTGIVIGSSMGNSGRTGYTDAVAYGTNVNLQAPATNPVGYTFSHWTLNGVAKASGQKSLTFTMTAGAATAVAVYNSAP